MSQSILDRPDVLPFLFHPRREMDIPYSTPDVRLILVEVESGISIGGRLYPAGTHDPLILYFHGNGEIAADYDDIASLYLQLDISLLVMDYRGYGLSGGTPSAQNLLTDALTLFTATDGILDENHLNASKLFVMGRSLGSAAAIEVARNAGESLDGLIIESGFADTFALLERLGIQVLDADESQGGFDNLNKIHQVTIPTLVIHGESDVLIPVSDGRQLYANCGTEDKKLVLIPGAGHNDLMLIGVRFYFEAIRNFVYGEW
jgi:fermentation-respiration switch protein FrsA (DUF1100 family)